MYCLILCDDSIDIIYPILFFNHTLQYDIIPIKLLHIWTCYDESRDNMPIPVLAGEILQFGPKDANKCKPVLPRLLSGYHIYFCWKVCSVSALFDCSDNEAALDADPLTPRLATPTLIEVFYSPLPSQHRLE